MFASSESKSPSPRSVVSLLHQTHLRMDQSPVWKVWEGELLITIQLTARPNDKGSFETRIPPSCAKKDSGVGEVPKGRPLSLVVSYGAIELGPVQ
ncbi:hypothetical protein ZHAS_00018390 [Anopheles sinensis]|uniref:Uncharacterized protein n=1 Tax=Anopheles sinensis TaxID=74873 RepID=A0A084WHP2_ANOSI|nr:hypothetical protein ZHAS_00018390 [Anopheles sinensis]